ncbi:MAG: hypothetical protein CMJ70_26185 [Planctomycetaceae bacterium]|nr:hypothetical protein [Planctomycetaceae bacterium]HAA69311.1 hypothetical protein [Planctomycetaceae bacterium]
MRLRYYHSPVAYRPWHTNLCTKHYQFEILQREHAPYSNQTLGALTGLESLQKSTLLCPRAIVLVADVTRPGETLLTLTLSLMPLSHQSSE